MKNTRKSAKSIKKSIIISTVAIVICLIGVILQFVMDKKWDAAGCGILACNATILFCDLDAYKKIQQEEKD